MKLSSWMRKAQYWYRKAKFGHSKRHWRTSEPELFLFNGKVYVYCGKCKKFLISFNSEGEVAQKG